jgi:hypothetical protein
MKVKVIKLFRDKHTNLLHEIGETLEVTDKRCEEINSTSFGVFVEEIKEEAPPIKPEVTANVIEDEVKVTELPNIDPIVIPGTAEAQQIEPAVTADVIENNETAVEAQNEESITIPIIVEPEKVAEEVKEEKKSTKK